MRQFEMRGTDILLSLETKEVPRKSGRLFVLKGTIAVEDNLEASAAYRRLMSGIDKKEGYGGKAYLPE